MTIASEDILVIEHPWQCECGAYHVYKRSYWVGLHQPGVALLSVSCPACGRTQELCLIHHPDNQVALTTVP